MCDTLFVKVAEWHKKICCNKNNEVNHLNDDKKRDI